MLRNINQEPSKFHSESLSQQVQAYFADAETVELVPNTLREKSLKGNIYGQNTCSGVFVDIFQMMVASSECEDDYRPFGPDDKLLQEYLKKRNPKQIKIKTKPGEKK